MKPFFEVLLLAATILLFAIGYVPAAIFVGMFAAIIWFAPSYKGKSVEQIIAEANGAGTDTVYVEYTFVSEPEETFTASLNHYATCPITEELILPKLAEYVTEHTGIPIEAERLHITKIQAL